MLIIDEISFASKANFSKLHENLRRLKQKMHLPYGGVHMVFSGDMRQLEPVGKYTEAIYNEDCPEFKAWLNCFLELKGMHRFKDDLEWGKLLSRIRDGEATQQDIDTINESVVHRDQELPADIKYATYFNRDRDAINSALFEKRCAYIYDKYGNTKDTILIFSDDISVKDGKGVYIPFRNCPAFWEGCGEDDVKPPRKMGRMDPVLKLYHSCRVMVPFNKAVSKGQANGTQATVLKVVLKPGVTPTTVLVGGKIPVAAVRATQVDHVVLKHCNDRVEPQIFSMQPMQYSFIAKMPKPRILQTRGSERERIRMKATQVPLLVNNATTGHKLQGSGVDNLFVHAWSYVTNWPYVMLSRVKTRNGLFMRKALSKRLENYRVPPALTRMLTQFRRRLSPSYWTEEEYTHYFFDADNSRDEPGHNYL